MAIVAELAKRIRNVHGDLNYRTKKEEIYKNLQNERS